MHLAQESRVTTDSDVLFMLLSLGGSIGGILNTYLSHFQTDDLCISTFTRRNVPIVATKDPCPVRDLLADKSSGINQTSSTYTILLNSIIAKLGLILTQRYARRIAAKVLRRICNKRSPPTSDVKQPEDKVLVTRIDVALFHMPVVGFEI